MKKIGIIAAMESEMQALAANMQDVRTQYHASLPYYTGTLCGVPVTVCVCGVGKVNAAICAQALINEFGADRVINTGVAGSLDARIDIGDVVVSTDCVQYDMSVSVFDYPLGLVPGFE